MNRPGKNARIGLIYVLLLCLLLTACGNQREIIPETVDKKDIPFYRHIAGRMDDSTGWYFQFLKEGLKEEEEAPLYAFQGLNLRYRYHEDYWSYNYRQDQNPDGSCSYYRVQSKSGVLRHGEGGETQLADRVIIRKLLTEHPSTLELLQIAQEDRDSYSFTTIDRDLFFDLLQESLGSPACEPGKYQLYWQKPSYAMEVEPDYLDNYKFQVAFVMRMGQIGELYIDVLYKTGDNYDDYVQLSDLVDEWKADEEQVLAFILIQEIRSAIREEGHFLAAADRYKDRTIGGIDFSRLYKFMTAIHNNEDAAYTNSRENRPLIEQEISQDEFESAYGT